MERARPEQEAQGVEDKKSYTRPTLVVYGSITKLTQGISASGAEVGVGMMPFPPCL